jgi:hypothetical protein
MISSKRSPRKPGAKSTSVCEAKSPLGDLGVGIGNKKAPDFSGAFSPCNYFFGELSLFRVF